VGPASEPSRPNREGPASEASISPGARMLSFLRGHPILCLALLTPGIPEYLSTSSPVLNLAVNPFWFLLQLAVNVGQYTAGALLVREAMLRWRKGWASVFLLGLAYGVTEEGLGDNTYFNSNQGADGVLGSFGRFQGVNWVWATGVASFHVVYSIGLAILLLGLALPKTRGRSLLGRRGMVAAFLSLGATTAFETAIVYGSYRFWMGVPLLVASAAVIVALVALAYRVPSNLVQPAHEVPSLRPIWAGTIGFSVFPVLFLLEYGGAYRGAPAAAIIAGEVVFLATMFEVVRRGIGRRGGEYLRVNLAFGFVLWQAVFGVLLTIGLPYTLPLVAVALAFFVRLRRAYAPGSRPAGPSGNVRT
jgi:hypothetical protein